MEAWVGNRLWSLGKLVERALANQGAQMNQKLAVTDVRGVNEPEPAVVEIVVALADDSTATLRMNVLTLKKLLAVIHPIAESD
jgi:hypothetical protein